MRTRLLALAAASALQYTVPAPAGAAIYAGNVCTSLVSVCVGGCNRGDVVRVQVIGHGYGDAHCGDAVAWCDTDAQLDTCSRGDMTFTSGSWIRCLADPYGSDFAIAICRSEPPVDR